MTPFGRAFADVIAAVVPKFAVTVYGRRIGSVMTESVVVVVSPVHPQKLAPASTGVSRTARPPGTKSPARLIAGSAVTDPPEVEFAISLKSRPTVAVSAPPARLPTIACAFVPPSDAPPTGPRGRRIAA